MAALITLKIAVFAANADGQREHGDRREAGTLAQHAQAVANVLQQSFHVYLDYGVATAGIFACGFAGSLVIQPSNNWIVRSP